MAALNLRWYKACKRDLSVSFIISKKVPLEGEEWPCSAELTCATELMAKLCFRKACRNITMLAAEFTVHINQVNQNDASNIHLKVVKFFSPIHIPLKKIFLRISELLAITYSQGHCCMDAVKQKSELNFSYFKVLKIRRKLLKGQVGSLCNVNNIF